MLKVQTIKKQLESFFKNYQYRYVYMNNKIKSLSVPVYLLRFNVMSEEDKIKNEITVMVSVFPSSHTICFECLNLYHLNGKESFDILNKINTANNYSFPGKFVLKEDGSVTYCCFIDYSHANKIHNDIILSIIDSIPPAYFIFFDIINANEEKEN